MTRHTDPMKAVVAALIPAMQQLTSSIEETVQIFIEAVVSFASVGVEDIRHIPFRGPDEHPADYAMRVGPASGHTIHPDEAWRWRGRAYSDWWGHMDKDRAADRLFHAQGRHDDD